LRDSANGKFRERGLHAKHQEGGWSYNGAEKAKKKITLYDATIWRATGISHFNNLVSATRGIDQMVVET